MSNDIKNNVTSIYARKIQFMKTFLESSLFEFDRKQYYIGSYHNDFFDWCYDGFYTRKGVYKMTDSSDFIYLADRIIKSENWPIAYNENDKKLMIDILPTLNIYIATDEAFDADSYEIANQI